MKISFSCFAAAMALLLLAGCAAGQAATTAPTSVAPAPPVSSAPPELAPEESSSEPEPEPETTLYEMAYELPDTWESEYDYGDRSFLLDTLPQTEAEAAVCLYWQAEQSGEFIRHSYLWHDGWQEHMQVMIGNAYAQREEDGGGFARVRVQALQELTRAETVNAWNAVYDERLLQHYHEAAESGDGYESYVGALYDGGYRVIYLKLDTEYLPQTAAGGPQYPDGEREMCYLTGPDDNGDTVLYANSYGYAILMPNPGDEPLPISSAP